MAERKVRKTAGKTAANTTKRTATKTTAKTAAKRTTRTKAAAKEDFRIGELDQYLFSMGTHYDIYKKMAAKGWYPSEQAEPQKIQKVKQKYSANATN